MNKETTKTLLLLLRSAFSGVELSEKEKSAITPEMLSELMKLSQKHDISHLIGRGLFINGLVDHKMMARSDEDAGKQLYRAQLVAVYRYERLSHELESICNALEEASIQFVPLKGFVLNQYYTEPWLRTSCDIDVLVNEKELDRAIKVFMERLGYKHDGKGSHDVSFFTPLEQHVELHYRLMEDGLINASNEILSKVWDEITPKAGHTYFGEMSDEMFYFYHIAHMAKHFESGGCGVRSIIDLFILDNMKGADTEKRNALLEKGGLLRFAETARRLSRIWLENAVSDELAERMGKYILDGGVYGTNENRIAVQQQKTGGRLRYILSRVFLPYESLKFHYPILQKHRWLTPFMEIRRWFKLVFCGHFRRVKKELNYNQSIDKASAEETRRFLCDIGLIQEKND